MSVAILRAPEGLDFTGLIAETSVTVAPTVVAPVLTTPIANDLPTAPSADVPSVNLNPTAMKQSTSASGLTNADGKNIGQSQESLQSHGNNSPRLNGYIIYWKIQFSPLFLSVFLFILAPWRFQRFSPTFWRGKISKEKILLLNGTRMFLPVSCRLLVTNK